MGGAAPVLVVDDDPMVLELLRALLEGDGLAVRTAGDGVTAIEAAGRRPALVLLDLELAAEDGATVAAQLRALHGSDLPILLVSGRPDVEQCAREVAASGWVRKPFRRDALLSLVHRLLDRSCA